VLIRGRCLRWPARKGQQSDIACLLDGSREASLVRSADPGQTPWHDFAALGHKTGEQAHVLVIDVVDLLGA